MALSEKLTLPLEEIKKLYENGQSTVTIARTFRVGTTTINRRLSAEGIQLRKANDPRAQEEKLRLFWSKVDKNGPIPTHYPELGPCWIWTGALARGGYGKFRNGTKTVRAHRFAYELEHGPIERDIFGEEVHTMHLCDNPACVRGSHLSKGMQSENIADMVVKGRSARK